MDKKWDVSFFYHEFDSKIQYLIQNLRKNDRAYKVGFRHEDYVPGRPIHEESLSLMSGSKRIAFFMTKKFFMCQQCCDDFKFAIYTPDFSKR